MARFVFSMQNLLNIKEQMENQAKMEYANAQDRLRQREQELQDLEDEKAAIYEKGRQMRLTTINVLDLKENKASLEHMDEVIARQKRRVETARDDVEDALEQLRLAMQERKTIEILREKAFAQYLEEEKAREGKEVDELVSYTYGLRIKENANGGTSGS